MEWFDGAVNEIKMHQGSEKDSECIYRWPI